MYNNSYYYQLSIWHHHHATNLWNSCCWKCSVVKLGTNYVIMAKAGCHFNDLWKARHNQGSTCTANCVIADILSVGTELGHCVVG